MKRFISRIALTTSTVALVVSGFAGTASAAAITNKSVELASNVVGYAGNTAVVTFQSKTAITDKCLEVVFPTTGFTLTGDNTSVAVDYSNDSLPTSSDNITSGTIVYNATGDGKIKVPFTGTLETSRTITVVANQMTNSDTAGSYDVVVNTYGTADCTGDVTDTGTVASALVSDSVTQNVAVAKALEFNMQGNADNYYMVDPATNQLDTNSNILSVRTNADSYTVFISSTPLKRADDVVFLKDGWTGSKATPAAFGDTGVGFGYQISANSGSDVVAFVGGNYAAFPEANTTDTVMHKTGPTGGTANTATIIYGAKTGWSTKSGNYSAVTTYNVVPSYY